MKVVMVETFEGTNGRLGRCAIVEVKASNEESAAWELQKFRYTEIQEFTPGAVPAEKAREIALQNAPVNVPVFYGGVFQVKKIAG